MPFKGDELRIADRVFGSRLLVGTAGYPDPHTLVEAIQASGAEMVTVSMRRFNVVNSHMASVLGQLELHLLPNTAGCHTSKEAVFTAQLAREALGTHWIKVEVMGDRKTLMPDVVELLKAATELVREGFVVLPYCNDDPITCRKLADLGCAAVMPLGSPIGSGMGILNPYNLQLIREQVDIPVILDAGVGTPSDVTRALELGLDGVLLNTAIAQAEHPVMMASAMKLAAQSGRLAYQSGRIPRRTYATASSPTEGLCICPS
jgi:thiazole synthase